MPKIVDHSHRRSDLAQAASRVIAAQGVASASLRDVAAAGGVTTGAVTHYFPGRTELVAAAYDTVMGKLLDRLDEPGGNGDRLATIASYLPQDPDSEVEWRVWLAFSAEALINPALRARHCAYYVAISSRLAADLSPVQADLVIALVDGLAIRILLEPDDWPAARVAATLSVVLPILV